MSLQGNGSNHNRRADADDANDSFFSFREGSEFERITGEKHLPSDASYGEDEERASKLQQAIEQENSSAYEDLDDFIYTQNKRRHKSSGSGHHHHHHRRGSVEGLSSGKRRRKSSSSSHHRHKHHYHRHHRKKMKRWQKIIIGLLVTIIVLIIGIVSAVFFMIINGRNSLLGSNVNMKIPESISSTENGKFIIYKDQKYVFNSNITSFLCMGIDKEAFSDINGQVGTGGDADTIFVLAMDVETGEMNIINISRDTIADIGIYSVNGTYVGTEKAQICLAYAYGDGKETSCNNELTAVRNLLYNVPINTYLALDLQGIGAINDAVGGVEVVSPETIGVFKQGEKYLLKGSLAMDFVRTRSHSTIEGNNLRMQRQKVYLDSFMSNVFDKTKQNLTTPFDIFNQSSPYICTNLDASKITYLASKAIQGTFNNESVIRTVEGKMKHKDDGYAEFYVDEDKLFELFLDIYYNPAGAVE